jgi:hypothetical protein
VVEEHQRQRLLAAFGEAVMNLGYAATTVKDVIEPAQVPRLTIREQGRGVSRGAL